jgi:branched-chain amino acid aminotransferase
LADLYRGLPLGVYTALRTFEHNKFLHLNRHLGRTERSMALLGWNYRLDRARLLRALHAVATAAEWPQESGPEMRVRIDVLAGSAEALGAAGRELIALQPFTPPPPELYETGVAVDFATGLARERPLAKTADFAAKRPVTAGLRGSDELRVTSDESEEALNSSLVTRHSSLVPYEYLLLDNRRRILEGTGTNFWAVRDGVVYTAGEGVLEGITREIILKLLPELGVPARLESVGIDDIPRLDEAALSGSSRAFLPVVSIAGQPVGDGRPGPISRRILEAYYAFVTENIRTAI